jgi:hypothetical protein
MDNMKLEYQLEKTWTDSYCGAWVQVWSVTEEEYLREINDVTTKRYGSVSTLVERRCPTVLNWFSCYRQSWDLYLMVLDCDSTDAMLACCRVLNQDEIGYALIQSSPSHYWVVTDYIDTFNNVITKMKTLPGADERHVNHASHIGRVSVRGVAVPGRVPIFYNDLEGLRDQRAVGWYRALHQLYETPAIKRRLLVATLQQKVADGTLLSAAADPEFQL